MWSALCGRNDVDISSFGKRITVIPKQLPGEPQPMLHTGCFPRATQNEGGLCAHIVVECSIPNSSRYLRQGRGIEIETLSMF